MNTKRKVKQYKYTNCIKRNAPVSSHKYWDKVGLFFTDTSEDGGLRKIVSIQKCTTFKKGKGSNTLFYKMYDPDEFPHSEPSDDSDFFHIPCREVYSHKSTRYEDDMNIRCMRTAITMKDIYFNQILSMDEFTDQEKIEIHSLMSNSFSCIDDNVPNALRVNCNDIPPPKNFRDLASHPEA